MSELYDIGELLDGTFPLSFKIIDRYQREYLFLTEKLNSIEYQEGSFRGGQNTIKLEMHKSKIVITQKLQKYVVKCYHTYILHLGLDKIEAMIRQHLYCPGIISPVYREVTRYDVCQRTKWSSKQTVNYRQIWRNKHREINYV